MKKSAHGKPVIIVGDETNLLEKVSPFSEKQIQDLVFENPLCLPISDIDESYNPVLPVCKELRTGAGDIDILMVTPNGDLLIVETKLWKNPGSRREVVGQILDYAKELSMWSYSDLEREINKNLGAKGNQLYSIARKDNERVVLNEADFVDAVSRNLRLGKFLLIIAGDGIREGAQNLVGFIRRAGNLNFSLAMVELPVFQGKNGELIVFPRTIVKTVEVEKISITAPEGFRVLLGDPEFAKKNKKESNGDFFGGFWKDFVDQLRFDDPEQALPTPSKMKNAYISPGGAYNNGNWISCAFVASKKKVVVYFKFEESPRGLSQKQLLGVYKDAIKKELGMGVKWSWDEKKYEAFSVSKNIEDVYSSENKEVIISFFNNWLNKFVNVLRPRLKKIL